MAKTRPNISFLIQLSIFLDYEILLLKGTNIGICDATLNEKYLLSVENALHRDQSTRKEDRAALYLTKKAGTGVDPPVIASVLAFSDLEDEKRHENKRVLLKIEHLWHPDLNGRYNITEHRINIATSAPRQYSNHTEQVHGQAKSFKIARKTT